MNSFNGIGRLVKDIEITEKNEIKLGRFTIAIPRNWKNADGNYESDFLNCVLFNASDYIKDNLKKGSLVSIEGRIQTRSYEVNGTKKYSTDIIVNRVNILSKVENKGGTYEVLDKHTKTNMQETFEYTDDDLPWGD